MCLLEVNQYQSKWGYTNMHHDHYLQINNDPLKEEAKIRTKSGQKANKVSSGAPDAEQRVRGNCTT